MQNLTMPEHTRTIKPSKPSSIGVVLLPILFFGYLTISSFLEGEPTAALWLFLLITVAFIVRSAIIINKEWEEAIILRLGKYNRSIRAGLFLKIPMIEKVIKRDMRIRTLDIPKQEVITKDNISVKIDAVVFMKVIDSLKSIVKIQDFEYSVKQYAQTTLRNVVGRYDLDDLLSKREEVAKEIRKIVDEIAVEWGVDIIQVELQDIELPEDMKRVMARQAEAEREKRGVIIKSEGEMIAAKNLRKAAEELMKSPIAFELRKLSTISDVSQDQSNTIVFAVPLESLALTMAATSGVKVPKPKTTAKGSIKIWKE